MELRRRFYVREVRFDPYQLVSVAQRLTIAGLPMIEFAQSVPNLPRRARICSRLSRVTTWSRIRIQMCA